MQRLHSALTKKCEMYFMVKDVIIVLCFRCNISHKTKNCQWHLQYFFCLAEKEKYTIGGCLMRQLMQLNSLHLYNFILPLSLLCKNGIKTKSNPSWTILLSDILKCLISFQFSMFIQSDCIDMQTFSKGIITPVLIHKCCNSWLFIWAFWIIAWYLPH